MPNKNKTKQNNIMTITKLKSKCIKLKKEFDNSTNPIKQYNKMNELFNVELQLNYKLSL